MHTCSAQFPQHHCHGLLALAVFRPYLHLESLFCTSHKHKRSRVCPAGSDRNIGILHYIVKTIIKHCRQDHIDKAVGYTYKSIAIMSWYRIIFKEHLECRCRHLLVLVKNKNRRIVVRHCIVFKLSCILLGSRKLTENRFYFLLHLFDVNVSHDNNTLKVRTVPFIIICSQHLWLEVVYNAHQTYRKSFGIFASWHQDG